MNNHMNGQNQLNEVLSVLNNKMDLLNGALIDLTVRINALLEYLKDKEVVDEKEFVDSYLKNAINNFKKEVEKVNKEMNKTIKTQESNIIVPDISLKK